MEILNVICDGKGQAGDIDLLEELGECCKGSRSAPWARPRPIPCSPPSAISR